MVSSDLSAVMALVSKLTQAKGRSVIAIAGPPGSGKSTLAEQVVQNINSQMREDVAAVVPMDGFHLDNSLLIERGLLSRKGSPDTFDVDGFANLLKTIKGTRVDIRYPLFDRPSDQIIQNAALLKATTTVVVVEGNYLLLDQTPWDRLAAFFDASIFLAPAFDVLEQRLMARWLNLGFSHEAAKEKVESNDLKNAKLVLTRSQSTDLRLDCSNETPS